MATYSGNQDRDPHLVEKDSQPLRHEPSLRLRSHSTTGFSWGYGGSGPAQLALALLYDATGDERVALQWHQPFKEEFVANWGEEWQITSKEIKDWIAAKTTCICDPKRRSDQQRINPYCKAKHADDGHLERPDEIRFAGSED